jgi:hypothetical protein
MGSLASGMEAPSVEKKEGFYFRLFLCQP